MNLATNISYRHRESYVPCEEQPPEQRTSISIRATSKRNQTRKQTSDKNAIALIKAYLAGVAALLIVLATQLITFKITIAYLFGATAMLLVSLKIGHVDRP